MDLEVFVENTKKEDQFWDGELWTQYLHTVLMMGNQNSKTLFQIPPTPTYR